MYIKPAPKTPTPYKSYGDLIRDCFDVLKKTEKPEV